MKRRAFLRTGAAATLAGSLAGCSGGGGSTEFTLTIAEKKITETDDGYVAVEVTVVNAGERTQSGTLYVTAKVNGEKSVEVRQVTIPAHSTDIVLVAYDVKYANVTSFVPNATIRPSDDDD